MSSGWVLGSITLLAPTRYYLCLWSFAAFYLYFHNYAHRTTNTIRVAVAHLYNNRGKGWQGVIGSWSHIEYNVFCCFIAMLHRCFACASIIYTYTQIMRLKHTTMHIYIKIYIYIWVDSKTIATKAPLE